VGFYFNKKIEDATQKYEAARNQIETIKFRDDRDTYKTVRDLCYLGGAVGLTSLTVSIALPIIRK
jgi:hypothetical protein